VANQVYLDAAKMLKAAARHLTVAAAGDREENTRPALLLAYTNIDAAVARVPRPDCPAPAASKEE